MVNISINAAKNVPGERQNQITTGTKMRRLLNYQEKIIK